MAKILGVIFLLLATIMLAHTFSAEGKTNMDEYEWLPTESSYEMFPMRIIKGDLIFNDRSSLYIPSRKIMVNGWGELGSIHIVGDKLKPLPTKLNISWFSFTEDKFYSGIFSLPYEKIVKLFREGVQSHITGKNITYQNVIVGVAPAGEISVWLMADGEVLLVANYRAKETVMDWKSVTENEEFSRSTYIKRVLSRSLSKDQVSELAEHGIPFSKLEAHGKQYSWNPEVTGSKPSHIWLKTYNGECEFIDFLKDVKTVETYGQPQSILTSIGRIKPVQNIPVT